MANRASSMFGAEAAKRQMEQEALESQLKNESAAQESSENNAPAAQESSENNTPAAQVNDDDKIIRMNISITKGYHKKLMAYSRKKCLPASALIRMWIDEHCD